MKPVRPTPKPLTNLYWC